MPAGFYYKMFHKPRWIWPFAQEILRRIAGLGKIDCNMPDAVYEKQYHNAEVCVIGGGPAGIRAALSASKAGVRVILLERRNCLGGFLNYQESPVYNETPAYLHGKNLTKEAHAQENITILLSTSATSIYQSNHVTAIQRGGPKDFFRLRYHEIRARSVIVATGTIERPLVFENNDAPGIMQASCAQQLLNSYGLMPGKKAVISGCHDRMLEVAADLYDAGVDVAAVADIRFEGFCQVALKRLKRRKIPFYSGTVVTKAKTIGVLRGVILGSVKEKNQWHFSCDLLVTSAGETPLNQLLYVAGAKMSFDAETNQFMPVAWPAGLHAAGGVMALSDLEAIEAQGTLSGMKALRDVGLNVDRDIQATSERLKNLPGPYKGTTVVDTAGKGWTRFVCFDEDVTVKEIKEAIAEGFNRPELIKRYTAAGTGPSQSYFSGYSLPLLVAALKGMKPGSMQPTTVRPPIEPTSLAVLKGRGYHPVKVTPFHAQQKKLGAKFHLMGAWKRARHFKSEKHVVNEVDNVRNNVAFIDISTLGKFRVYGPDALNLLQRVYVRDMSKVTEGKLTYAVMCTEEGVVIDDGVVTKLGDDDYAFTTSTARAPHTIEWLTFHSKNEGWETYVVNLTEALAAINLVGPRARELLSSLTTEDVSNTALPYMGFRKLTLVGGVRAYVARVGFVGELCYEIHVPASKGPGLLDIVLKKGKAFEMMPFGTEAQTVLRLEKGHLVIVVDTDNHTTLHEIGLTKIWDRGKKECKTVGAPALRFAQKQSHRQKLVGFMMNNVHERAPDGSVIVAQGQVKGRVCTSRYSPTLRQSIGMALVDPDLARDGGGLEIYTDQKLVKGRLPNRQTMLAKIVPMPFYDPQGKRIRA
jgi:sarcosine oxidase subunit alpha